MAAAPLTPYYKTVSDLPGPIRVVPGQAVSAQPYGSHRETLLDGGPSDGGRRDAPRGGCRDCIWTILFYAHLGVILYCSIAYTPQLVQDVAEADLGGGGGRRLQGLLPMRRALQQGGDDGGGEGTDLTVDPSALLSLVALAFAASLVVSTLALGFLMMFAESLVKLSLFCNVALMLGLGALSLVGGAAGAGALFLVLAALAAYYTCRVWARIPFAASNLKTAVTAVRSNLGLGTYAYLSIVLILLWSIWWTITFLSTVYVTNGCDLAGDCESEVNGGVAFLFLLSYYWTIQVIANVVHCTTAGTVGTWWLYPLEANGCCSKAVRASYLRSITTSFGSICFASLVVAIIQAVRELIYSLRENGDSFIACCADCLLACIESLVEIFNRFALVYVAVHGQSFLQAGRSVMDLFRARGWTTIITDILADTVLSMVSLGVGLLVGLVCVGVGSALGMASAGELGSALGLGFIVGYACCSTLFSVVGSAVNTVIVLYAECPQEFEMNHPELSHQMRASWRQAWPNEFTY